MKRSFTLFGAVLLSAVVPSTAVYLVASNASAATSNDFARGEGKFSKGQPAEQFYFSADGSPTSAKGSVRFNSASLGEARGTVDCLFVSGNKAAMAGSFEQPLGGQYPFFVLAVQDNGDARKAVAADQAVLIGESTHTGDADCGLTTATSLGPMPLIVQGNLTVKDR